MSVKSMMDDILYGLEREFGERLTVRRETPTPNLDTGEVTVSVLEFPVTRAIPLPLNLRAQFLKAAGINRSLYLETGQREILIRKQWVAQEIKINDIVVTGTSRESVQRFDDYEAALILVVQK